MICSSVSRTWPSESMMRFAPSLILPFAFSRELLFMNGSFRFHLDLFHRPAPLVNALELLLRGCLLSSLPHKRVCRNCPRHGLSSRTNVRDLRFLPAVEMTAQVNRDDVWIL